MRSSMRQMRDSYGVPVARGMRLQYTGCRGHIESSDKPKIWMIVTSANSQYIFGYIEGETQRQSFHALDLVWPWNPPKRIRPTSYGSMIKSSLRGERDYEAMKQAKNQ